MTADLLTASASELASMIRARAVSSEEVVSAHLERIAEVNPRINAVVQLAPDALARAREADVALARGDEVGALHGLPFTAKDWLESAGLICAAGFNERATYVPSRDAVVVARMRDAGAILLGKTNVVDGGGVYPRPNHPLDAARTPGISSSGEAAIIAAGGSPAGLASDSGGSIRWPAHCCGVAGLKPTTGLVPNTGHFPRLGHLSDPRTAIGPMARSARDLGLVLRVIAGADAGDPGSVPVPLGDPERVELRGLRVAWHTEFPGATPTPETVATVEAAARVLEERGCLVTPAAPPRLDESMPISRAYWATVQSASMREWAPDKESSLSAEALQRSRFEWERFTRSMLEFMRDYDLVLSPAASRPAPGHDEWDRDEFLYTLPYSLTRQPAAVIRVGVSPEGLPIGVQIAARSWEDHLAIAAAIALEDAR